MNEHPPVSSPPAWAERLNQWRDALPSSLPRAAAVAVGLVAVIAVAVAAVLLTRRPAPAPAVVLPRADQATTPTVADAGTGEGPAERPGASVTVHAAGALARPGVYVLPAEARVADVVAAAGGPLPDADLDQLNLATRLADGERVYLPRKGETPAASPPAGAPPAGATSPSGGGAATTRAQLVDLNTATVEQLDALPGVGPSIAGAIVEHRARNGRFRSVDDLLDVPGIGPAKLGVIRPLVRV